MTDRKQDIVERMAEAMVRAAGEPSGGWIIDDRLGLERVFIDGDVDMIALARAALMAMREPVNADKQSSIGNAIWRARIDAILAEAPPCPSAPGSVE